jgi:hypothetical protein
MKKYINKLITFCTIILISTSCSNDAELTVLKDVKFSSTIEATPSTVVLSATNVNASVMTIYWPAVKYPIDAPVSYSIEFDIVSDTFGTTPWANAIRFDAGESVLSKSFLGNDLNVLATSLGLQHDIVGEILVRVVANLDRKVYSAPITLNITTFTSQITFPQIYMVGGFQGWDFSNAATLPAISPGVFQGIITFPTTASKDFKFTTALNWNQFYGVNASGNFALSGNTNLSVPSYNSYRITVDLNTLSYTALPYSFGIIGTATAGGWNTSTAMNYDYQLHKWKYIGPLLAGAVKFRLNDAWTVNYGPAGSPAGNTNSGTVLNDAPGAHTINANGNYEITFTHDPNNPATAGYTVIQL